MIQLRHAASRFSYCIVIVATDTIDSVQGIANESKILWCSVQDSGCDAEPLIFFFLYTCALVVLPYQCLQHMKG